MKFYNVLISLSLTLQIVVPVTSSDSDCICGQRCGEEAQAYRVVGGNIVGEKNHPYLVLLLYYELYICGGSIVGSHFILTAGHCLVKRDGTKFPAEVISVAVGIHDRYMRAENDTLKVEEIIVHEDYKTVNDEILINDIALLRVEREIKFNDFIQPICLPFDISEKDYQAGLVQGWGVTTNHGFTSRFPRQAVMSLLTDEQCKQSVIGPILNQFNNIYKAVVCANRPYIDSCLGDSGGPLLVRDAEDTLIQIGLVSFGPEMCGSANGLAGMYTRLTAYRGWLQRHLTETCSPPRTEYTCETANN